MVFVNNNNNNNPPYFIFFNNFMIKILIVLFNDINHVM